MADMEEDMEHEESETGQLLPQHIPTVSSRRYLVLTAFSLLSFCSAAMWITFAPCLYIFVLFFFDHVSTATTNAINSMSAIYMLTYPCFVFLSFRYCKDPPDGPVGYGLKRGIILGASLTAMGGFFRFVGALPSQLGFVLVFAGQTLAAIGQIFIIGLPSRLAVAWFPHDEVNRATAVAVSANNLGIAAGFVITPLMIHEETAVVDIPRAMLYQFLFAFGCVILAMVGFARYPPQRHFLAQDDGAESDQVPVWKDVNFLYLVSAFGIINGVQNAIPTLLAQTILPVFGHADEATVGMLGFYMMIVGIPSSLLTGWYLDRYQLYSFTCRSLYAVTVATVIIFHLALEVGSFWLMTVSSILFGIFSWAIMPAIFQYAGELFYPLNEVISAGWLLGSGNLLGMLFVLIMGAMESSAGYTMRYANLFLISVLVVGMWHMWTVKGQLRRASALQGGSNG